MGGKTGYLGIAFFHSSYVIRCYDDDFWGWVLGYLMVEVSTRNLKGCAHQNTVNLMLVNVEVTCG